MPIMFNSILGQANIEPSNVILLRHKDKRASKGRTTFELWRYHRPDFEEYQSRQHIKNRTKFSRPTKWASFVGTPDGKTMFVGLYTAKYSGLLPDDRPSMYEDGKIDLAGSCDVYNLKLDPTFKDLSGTLFIDWGDGALSWAQRSERQNKVVTELRQRFEEPEFPGFFKFDMPLSSIQEWPQSWTSVLKACRGIYLLTCPKTGHLYVGKTEAGEGFVQRWSQHYVTGGDAVGLRLNPSDYRVSILEVAGTAAQDDILKMEQRWIDKLRPYLNAKAGTKKKPVRAIKL